MFSLAGRFVVGNRAGKICAAYKNLSFYFAEKAFPHIAETQKAGANFTTALRPMRKKLQSVEERYFAAAAVTLAILLKILLMLVEMPGRTAVAATAMKPASNASPEPTH